VQPQAVSCLNCGEEVSTNYCPNCGQENEPLRLGLRYILRDACEEFFKFDSKLFHTLKPLLTRPGYLSLEWARGRRIRYISPFKLYLTATFIFFLVASWNFSRNRDNLLGSGAQVASASEGDKPFDVKVKRGQGDAAPKPDEEDDLILGDAVPSNEAEAFVLHNFQKIDLDNKEDLKEVIGQMLEKMPHALFVLLPAFAFLLKLVYIRRGRYYVEHLVFALHNHSFHFLVLAIATPIPWKGADAFAFLGCITYFFLALKSYYNQSWPKTLFKGGMLGCAYLCLLGPTMLLAVFFGLMAMPEKKHDGDKKPVPKNEAPAKPAVARAARP
jgi:hypothetical protein